MVWDRVEVSVQVSVRLSVTVEPGCQVNSGPSGRTGDTAYIRKRWELSYF